MAFEEDLSPVWNEMNRQVGQLFMMGFDGTSVNQQIRTLIETYHVGSVLLTAQNLKSAEQATQLVLDLQRLAHNAGHPVPLAIALEQENGGMNSLVDETHIRQFPSALGLAATGSKELARETARATGHELSAVGVNWILGPSLNVLTTTKGPRAGGLITGNDPQEATSYGAEIIGGYQQAGLVTCGKGLPSVKNAEELEPLLDSQILIPFQAAFTRGLDAIMVGGDAIASHDHDPLYASSLECVAKDLLRIKMSFAGIIVSECLQVEACCDELIRDSSTAVMAIDAGCDIVSLCHNYSAQLGALTGLRLAAREGRIEKSKILQSLRRVLRMKSRFTSWEMALNPAGVNYLNQMQPSHVSLSTAVYNESITIVRDQKNLLPLRQVLGTDEEVLLLTPLVHPVNELATSQILQTEFGSSIPAESAGWHSGGSTMGGEGVFKGLGRAMARQRHGRILHTSYTANGLRPIHEDLIARAHVVVVVTAGADRNLYQYGFTKHVSTTCRLASGPDGKHREKPLIVVSVCSPHDFAFDGSIGTYVCTYDYTDAALQALVRALYGEIRPSGILPTSGSDIQGLYRPSSHWLVENFNEERDSSYLEALLSSARECRVPAEQSLLTGVSHRTFLVQHAGIEEAHFVVRDSTTQEIHGFCSSYIFKSSSVGAIGSIIVNPSKRKLSIGRSLHDRAVRHLVQQKGINRVQLGCRIPSIFLGLPTTDHGECKELKRRFAKMGWDIANSQTLSKMILRNLPTWIPPERLSHTLTNPNIKFDLVQGMNYADAILEHVGKSAKAGVFEIYQMALADKASCAVIRASRPADSFILGSLVLYKNDAKVASFIPALADTKGLTGGISSLVVSSSVEDSPLLIQGLVLLGVRQIKKQGASAVVIDSVESEFGTDSLSSMGLTLLQTFEEITNPTTDWTSKFKS